MVSRIKKTKNSKKRCFQKPMLSKNKGWRRFFFSITKVIVCCFWFHRSVWVASLPPLGEFSSTLITKANKLVASLPPLGEFSSTLITKANKLVASLPPLGELSSTLITKANKLVARLPPLGEFFSTFITKANRRRYESYDLDHYPTT